MKGQASDTSPHATLPSALSPTSGTWPEQCLQNSWKLLHCPCWKLKVAYVQNTDLKCHDPLVLVQLELLQPTEADPQGKGGCRLGGLSSVGFMDWVFL